ncbi:MAG TPA: hypothetical protein VK009_29985 [Chloroflexota bacterium]|nr:hypothetical protein [Chloroflexota bacterium]
MAKSRQQCCLFCATPEELDGHHVAGRAIDAKLLGPLCVEHHGDESEGQRLRGADLGHKRERTVLDAAAALLREVGYFLCSLGERLCWWGDNLDALIAALDANYPEWRDLPEAKGPRT